MTLSPGSAQIDPDRNSGKTQTLTQKEADPNSEKDAPWTTEAGKYPITLEPWQTEPATEGITPEAAAALLETLSGTDLNLDAGTLPSEEAGFTSDDSLAVNADESLNSWYSFWTKESYTRDAGQIIEKFINPRFGNWEAYQGRGSDPNGIDPAALFPNTFTDDYLKSGKPVAETLPIYADWANNNYGRGDLSATGPRWYGQIVSSASEFVYDTETGQYTVNFSAEVRYTAYKSNGEKVSEKGTLKLELVANPRSERGSGGKVLVNSSSLTMGG